MQSSINTGVIEHVFITGISSQETERKKKEDNHCCHYCDFAEETEETGDAGTLVLGMSESG